MKIQVVGSFFLIACLLTGCAGSEKLESAPPNALFCKNITENVQTIQHLHLPATPENPVSTASTAFPCGMWFTAMDYAEILTGKSEGRISGCRTATLSTSTGTGNSNCFSTSASICRCLLHFYLLYVGAFHVGRLFL